MEIDKLKSDYRSPYTKSFIAAFGKRRDPYDLADDPINPAHYKDYTGFEVIDITSQLNFCKGNAVKYILRAGKKDGNSERQDLEKAMWYIKEELKHLND